MDDDHQKVQLYIYDLSFGLSQILSPLILGKKFEGIWHTSVVTHGMEYYFGSQGIVSCQPGHTNLGSPLKVFDLGETAVDQFLLNEYIQGLKEHTFAVGTYDLFNHNCNTFSNELVQFLVGQEVPTEILKLPNDIIQAFKDKPQSDLINRISQIVTPDGRTSPDFDELNDDINAARRYY